LFELPSDLNVIDLSGNNFENIPDDLFLGNVELEKVILENDSCFNKTEKRTFPENLLLTNFNLKIFQYSANELSCDKVIFPPKLFSSKNISLIELKISQSSNLQWDDIKWLLQGQQNLSILDLTGNDIRY
jgi:hypothetical protein